jgi:hypothetical protein
VTDAPQKSFSNVTSTTTKQPIGNASRNPASSPTSAPTQTKSVNQTTGTTKQMASVSQTPVQTSVANTATTANLFDYEDTPAQTTNLPKQAPIIQPTPSPVEQDLFTFDEPPVQAQPKFASSKPSSALQNAAAAAGVNIDDNPTANLSRAELKSLHKAEIDDKVKRALENKQEVDDMQRKEAQELDIVSFLLLYCILCCITICIDW